MRDGNDILCDHCGRKVEAGEAFMQVQQRGGVIMDACCGEHAEALLRGGPRRAPGLFDAQDAMYGMVLLKRSVAVDLLELVREKIATIKDGKPMERMQWLVIADHLQDQICWLRADKHAHEVSRCTYRPFNLSLRHDPDLAGEVPQDVLDAASKLNDWAARSGQSRGEWMLMGLGEVRMWSDRVDALRAENKRIREIVATAERLLSDVRYLSGVGELRKSAAKLDDDGRMKE